MCCSMLNTDRHKKADDNYSFFFGFAGLHHVMNTVKHTGYDDTILVGFNCCTHGKNEGLQYICPSYETLLCNM